MKYVILFVQTGGPQGLITLHPVAFPESLSHYEVASMLHNGKRATPCAAGFYTMGRSRLGDWEPTVDPKRPSTSLQLGPGPFDKDLIEELILSNGNPINVARLWTEHPHYRQHAAAFSWTKLDKALKAAQPSIIR